MQSAIWYTWPATSSPAPHLASAAPAPRARCNARSNAASRGPAARRCTDPITAARRISVNANKKAVYMVMVRSWWTQRTLAAFVTAREERWFAGELLAS